MYDLSLQQKYLTLDAVNVFILTVKFLCKHLCDVVGMLFDRIEK